MYLTSSVIYCFCLSVITDLLDENNMLSSTHNTTLCLKKCTNLETVYLKIVSILMKFCRNIQKTQGSSLHFHVGLLFINFSSFKPDAKNNSNFDTASSKCGNFDSVQ